MKIKFETIKSPAISDKSGPRGTLRISNGVSTLRSFLTPTVCLIMALIVLLPVTAFALRQNNLNMVELREQLVSADQTGDVAEVQQAARHLQNYVAHHMNTTTGRVALQTLYNQAAEKAMAASRPIEVDSGKYQAATEDCKPTLRRSGYRAWANCVAGQVGLSSVNDLYANQVSPPDPDLYYIDFVPARLSFDLAGICLILSITGLIILAVRVLYGVIRMSIEYLGNKNKQKHHIRG